MYHWNQDNHRATKRSLNFFKSRLTAKNSLFWLNGKNMQANEQKFYLNNPGSRQTGKPVKTTDEKYRKENKKNIQSP